MSKELRPFENVFLEELYQLSYIVGRFDFLSEQICGDNYKGQDEAKKFLALIFREIYLKENKSAL